MIRVDHGQDWCEAPLEGFGGLENLAFAALWATGSDPQRGGLFRLSALRQDEGGGWEGFDRFVAPFGGTEAGEGASARMAREFGVTGAELAGAPPADEALGELRRFLGPGPVVVLDRARFVSWVGRPGADPAAGLRIVGLPSIAALLLPGRLAGEGEGLCAALLGTEELRRRPRAATAADVRRALAEIVGRVLKLDAATRALLAHGYLSAWRGLGEDEPEAAGELALALSLCEHPSRWAGGLDELFAAGGPLADGALTEVRSQHATPFEAAEATRPPCGAAAREERRREPMPSRADDPVVLDEADRRLVDEIMAEHLPRLFAERSSPDGAEPSYREGQHAVAQEIARTFGRRELQLVHAPTGTGKTLAYLVPVVLWALRNSVRIGIATYTRALQEQASDRDVPVARELLRRAGVGGELRIGVLKGRQNYLCWRALKHQAPPVGEPGTELLAWTLLCLFALSDPDGDLDRLPLRPPLSFRDAGPWGSSIARLLTLVRAESGCCLRREDREDCAGVASRRRAERSHVVVTNHAFALQRREFFKHLVFDECEHLHGQAQSAFSHAVSFRALRECLGRLHAPGGHPRLPLNRIAAVAAEGSEAASCARDSIDAKEASLAAIDELQHAVYAFKLWREDAGERREERDLHSLFREFVLQGDSGPLLDAHGSLGAALTQLTASLAEMSEHLDQLPTRAILRIRRSLDVLRGELDELVEGVLDWIPREDGAAAFRPETFYDLETTPRGHDVMAARVLLPHEHLGRHYYPQLEGALLISATTWLRGGFDAAAAYLGVERSAHPAQDEEREPMEVRCFRAPEVFDYGRVLVAVPRDAPSLRDGKQGFLDYVARFVAHLGERTGGRILVLFTNADDCIRTGRRIEHFFTERGIPFWYQRMEGTAKEELSELFRSRVDSVLLGLDTFWYGADFPGQTLEYLILVRLPYGVPDRYHHAQCASLGASEQRRQIYMPRALAKLRQGFGRLMRKETDRGCVFVLDGRILEPRHRIFLGELPIQDPFAGPEEKGGAATFVRGDTDRCLREALAHMGMLADVRRRGLDTGAFHSSLPRG